MMYDFLLSYFVYCLSFCLFFFFFFFQAEDGIRDRDVTGVQTCALPISQGASGHPAASLRPGPPAASGRSPALSARRSEERRVGKSVDLGGRRIIKKKKKKKNKTN